METRDEHGVSLHKLLEVVSYGVPGLSNADRLHHTGVPELTDAEGPVKLHGRLELVRFDAAYKEWVALPERFHQLFQRVLELKSEGGGLFPGLGVAGELVSTEEGGEELERRVL